MRVLRIHLQMKSPGPSCTMLGHLEANLRHLGLWAINWEAKWREWREENHCMPLTEAGVALGRF